MGCGLANHSLLNQSISNQASLCLKACVAIAARRCAIAAITEKLTLDSA
jgi:hypothetical protein